MDEKNEQILKSEVLNILFSNAQEYEARLLNKHLAFIYIEANKLCVMESVFMAENYLHLTGVEANKGITASRFFELCLDEKLSINDFNQKDFTTELKLSVLDRLINIQNNAKMIGNFNLQRPKLYTEKLVGNIYACIGFIKSRDQYYIPNTSLKEDVRDVVTHASRVIAIYSKGISERLYNKRLYLAKGIIPDQNIIPKQLQGRVALDYTMNTRELRQAMDGLKAEHKPDNSSKNKDKTLDR